MKLSLIIPCYNEAANLPLLVPRCIELCSAIEAEVILVDNGSTDQSPSVLAELLGGQENLRCVRVENNQGYGFGILSGLRAATGDVIGWCHADMQTDPMDCVVGMAFYTSHRTPEQLFVKGKRYGRSLSDQVFTVGMSVFETALMGKAMWDINAQPTLLPRKFFDTWDEPPHDFSLDLYAYFLARHQGLDVRRFDVPFGERAHGSSHWNVDLRAKWKFIKRTIRFSLQLKRKF
jgi:glycosyltransferase involved in cell wall biosynthesis